MKIDRREAIRRIGVSATLPVMVGYHPLVPVQEGEGTWRPRFFSSREIELLMELVERIVPATDTPGAKDALVHQYVDWVLSEADDDRKRLFREGLAELDVEGFTGLDDAEKDTLLRARERGASPFFFDAKALTVEGYYRSEIGMYQELGYAGNTYLSAFDGCTHEDH